MNLNERRISLIIFILLIIALFFMMVFYFSNFPIMLNDITDIILKRPAGIILASFFDRLFCVHFPLLLNIHPSDFKSEYFSYIESITVIFFIFVLNNFLIRKINIMYPICFLFTASLVFMFIQQVFLWLLVYDGFFRMLMPAFIFIGLIYLLITDKENSSLKKSFLVYLLTFLCCISNEMTCVSTITGFLILTIYSVKTKKNSQKMLLGLVISAVGGIIMIKTGAFMRKSEGITLNFQYFTGIIKMIPDYMKYYVKYVLINHIIGYILLISQILILYKRKPYLTLPPPPINTTDNEQIVKTIKIFLSFLFGIFLFFFLLIGLGKTHYTQGEYWVKHEDLHEILNIFLCAFNYALLNVIIESKIIKKQIICIVFILMSLIFIYSNYKYYVSINFENILFLRKESYKTEKIIRLANLRNKTALIDKNILSCFLLWSFYHTVIDNYYELEQKENIYYSSSEYTDFMNLFEKENKITNGFIFTDEETVNKEYAANGGVFTEEELKNIKFNRLRDKDFLLNN